MRERINRLARGILDPEALRLVITPAELTDTVHAGEVTRKIITVADEDGRFIKGLVYSSNLRVRVVNNAFGGVRNRITFEIDSMYLTQKDVITGALYLVTNAGEQKVPYSFSIEVEASGRTLENLQKVKDITGLKSYFFSADKLEAYGDANYLKGGIVYSDMVTTVSDSYAEEIKMPFYGEHLDGLMRARSNSLVGIVNGLDYNEYNPETDPMIFQNYSAKTFRKEKVKNKRGLQRELGL